MKEKILILFIMTLVTVSSYGQKFLKKYQKRYHVENLTNGHLVSGKGEFIIFDIDGNVKFEREKDAVVYWQYAKESNIVYYTIGHKLAKHACFRDTSSDVLCSYNVTTGEQKEYLFKDVSYVRLERGNRAKELLFYFTDVETGKKGVMKADGSYLFKPEYEIVNLFSESDDLFLAVKDKQYYVMDREGNNVLGEKFVYNSSISLTSYYLYNVIGLHPLLRCSE